jgi:hypothetical protein
VKLHVNSLNYGSVERILSPSTLWLALAWHVATTWLAPIAQLRAKEAGNSAVIHEVTHGVMRSRLPARELQRALH